MSHAGVEREYDSLWRREKFKVKRDLKMSRKRKVKFLERRYGNTEVKRVPDEIEGINVADKEIPTHFTSNPQCYGGSTINEKELKVLSLPPKFAVYEKINTVECEVEIEKGLAKLRWTKAKQVTADDDERSESNQAVEESKSVYNQEKMSFDFRNMRATDLPFNKRICLPGPLEEAAEISIQNLKGRLNQITSEYVEKKGQTKWSNLNKVEKEGLRSLTEKLQSKEEVIFQTDKSGRFSVDRVDNYKSTCEKHTNGDVDVTEEEYTKLQQVINAHAVSWVRMLSAGTGNNEQTRIKNNMIGTDSPIPPLYGLRKDHKPCQDDTEGPPLDPYVVQQRAMATGYHT